MTQYQNIVTTLSDRTGQKQGVGAFLILTFELVSYFDIRILFSWFGHFLKDLYYQIVALISERFVGEMNACIFSRTTVGFSPRLMVQMPSTVISIASDSALE